MRSASPDWMKAPPLAPFCRRTMPAISRLRSASRRALRPTPSCSASSRSAGQLVAGPQGAGGDLGADPLADLLERAPGVDRLEDRAARGAAAAALAAGGPAAFIVRAS
jgi:hypothetical protein